MNELKVLNQNGQLLVESREVAAMVGKDHSNLMRDIRGYVAILENSNLNSQQFFIFSTYKTEGNTKTYDCFLLTRKGCDMVANKMTGEKGVLFTAAYVTKFEEMEQRQPRVLTEKEQLIASMKLSLETSEELSAMKTDVALLKEKVNERITLDHGQQVALHHQIKKRIESIADDYDISRQKLYSQLHSHLRRAFVAPKYIFVKDKDFDEAMSWVSTWRPI